MRATHKTLATGGAIGLLTAAAVAGRRRKQPTLPEQAAEVRERYRKEAATLRSEGTRISDLWVLQTDAKRELNDLRVRYMQSLGSRWAQLSPLDKFRIGLEFGLDDPGSVPLEGN
jgi:hypothetical protein